MFQMFMTINISYFQWIFSGFRPPGANREWGAGTCGVSLKALLFPMIADMPLHPIHNRHQVALKAINKIHYQLSTPSCNVMALSVIGAIPEAFNLPNQLPRIYFQVIMHSNFTKWYVAVQANEHLGDYHIIINSIPKGENFLVCLFVWDWIASVLPITYKTGGNPFSTPLWNPSVKKKMLILGIQQNTPHPQYCKNVHAWKYGHLIITRSQNYARFLLGLG